MKATILDLRRRMSEILHALDLNECVTIFHRGKEKGVLYPTGRANGKERKASSHPAFGMWKNRKDIRDVDKFVRGIREGRSNAL